jgi:predicted small integral membrane protein
VGFKEKFQKCSTYRRKVLEAYHIILMQGIIPDALLSQLLYVSNTVKQMIKHRILKLEIYTLKTVLLHKNCNKIANAISKASSKLKEQLFI